jgi:hypothetical protein
MEVLNDVGLCQEKEDALFKKNCPHCYSEKVKIHSHYQTKGRHWYRLARSYKRCNTGGSRNQANLE